MIDDEIQAHFNKENATDLIDILRALARAECSPYLHGEPDGGVSVLINCNDLFYWACADAEPVGVGDLALIDETFNELRAVRNSIHDAWQNFEGLFCCRKRKMRPQNCILVKYPDHIRPLFERCGPVRTDKECG